MLLCVEKLTIHPIRIPKAFAYFILLEAFTSGFYIFMLQTRVVVRDGVHTHPATLIGMVPEMGGWVFSCADKEGQLDKISFT